MNPNLTAEELMQAITATGAIIAHPKWLRALIDAALPGDDAGMYDAAFKAKFLTRTWGVMRRLGANDAARDQLKNVFQQELHEVRLLLSSFAEKMQEHDRTEFTATYLAIDGAAFVRLMELLHDLSWVQHVKIDHRT